MRVFLLKRLLLLVLALLSGFAWLTGHPDALWLEQAEEWPVVGSLAERFRKAYLPPERAETPSGGGGVEIEYVLVGPDGRPIDETGPLRVDNEEQRALERLAASPEP